MHFMSSRLAVQFAISGYAIKAYALKKQKDGNNVFETCAVISPPGMKAQGDKGCGRILLGDNTGGGAFVLRSIGFQCAGFWFSTGLPCICESS
jgi:hypothetical protein